MVAFFAVIHRGTSQFDSKKIRTLTDQVPRLVRAECYQGCRIDTLLGRTWPTANQQNPNPAVVRGESDRVSEMAAGKSGRHWHLQPVATGNYRQFTANHGYEACWLTPMQ